MRNLVESKIKTGMSQRQLAKNIGISHGTVNNILAGIIPTSTKTLDKLAEYFNVSVESLRHDGGSHAAEPVFPYGTPTKLERLIELAQHLDRDELATLERCVDAFRRGDKKMTRHLIGQLELLERIPNDDEPDQAVKSRPS